MKILLIVFFLVPLFTIPVFASSHNLPTPEPEPVPEPVPEPEGTRYYSAYSYSTKCPTHQKLVMGNCYDIPEYPQDDDFQTLFHSARQFNAIGDFETALELIDKALQLDDVDRFGAFRTKADILAKMVRHSEALDAFLMYEKLTQKIDRWDYPDPMEAWLLYHLGKYSNAEKILIEIIQYVDENKPEGTNKKLELLGSLSILEIVAEKSGNEKLRESATDNLATLTSTSFNCGKASFLINTGGYVEAMGTLNIMEEYECPSGTVSDLKKLTQERINKYAKCGAGTILKDGFCVPERATMTTEMQQKSSNGGGCLIATATFGSELAPQVQQLREIRDNSLLQTESGSAFMESFNQFYYSFSPSIADLERDNPVFKEAVKIAITPLLTSLSILNYVYIDSEETVLGYGISLIILNVGMYFVAPIALFTKLKKMAST